jgi:hypothetical protein
MKIKLTVYVLIIATFFSLLFSMSEVNFKWEHLQISSLIKNFCIVVTPAVVSGLISYSMSIKAQKNARKNNFENIEKRR